MPQIWYVHEVNAIGMLYYHLARILLSVYDPHIPLIGPETARARRRVEEDIRNVLMLLCGIAMSTAHVQPVLAVTFTAISMFGSHAVDRREQEALLKILEELDRKHGWPVAREAESLKQGWDWV